MYIKRNAESLLADILESGKVGIIIGARQVGKTTLVEHVLTGRDAVFINFDMAFQSNKSTLTTLLPSSPQALTRGPTIG